MSVFLEFQLPSPATWFYWSLMLSVALFFQFRRPLSVRNFDLLALYLFVPGVLLVQFGEGHHFLGYVWLLGASGFWLIRALLDGVLTRRPAYRANLNQPGLSLVRRRAVRSLDRRGDPQTGRGGGNDRPLPCGDQRGDGPGHRGCPASRAGGR